MSICAVIMAGGSGSRLWPVSRAKHPKQFLVLDGKDTMLQATVKRLSELKVDSTVTICNEEHRFFVAEQLREIGQLGKIILEPVGRNTAPAIALAAFNTENDPLLLVLAADHVIKDQNAFTEAITSAIPLAEAGKLVTFGIVPKLAHTGYGYIKRGGVEGPGFVVDRFVEKPSLETASHYLETNEYYWNSGMFLFKASRYLEELESFRPDIFSACQSAISEPQMDMDFIRINKKKFNACPAESIDYALMEKTSDAVVVPMDAGWNDIGSWSSLWDIGVKDQNGNINVGDVLSHNTGNSYIRSEDRLVVAIGVDDLVIVDTKDVIMVAAKDCVQDIKDIVELLKVEGRAEFELHREVSRPWGKYDSIDKGKRYQVKRITVNPGAKLSLQMHQHRTEHWVVVSGEAKVTKGEEIFLLSENESTYIPIGVIHSLENPGSDILELIEVQSGDYLGEDDITRFEDIYGRL